MTGSQIAERRVAPLVRIFFKKTTPEQVQRDLDAANHDGHAAIGNIIENNYKAVEAVVDCVWRTWTFNGRVSPNFMLTPTDCVGIAAACLLTNLAPKLRTSATPGEAVHMLCMWTEQKVRRAIMGEKGHSDGLWIKKIEAEAEGDEGLHSEHGAGNEEKDYIKVQKRFFPRHEHDEERDINDSIDRIMARHNLFDTGSKTHDQVSIRRNGKAYLIGKGCANAGSLMVSSA